MKNYKLYSKILKRIKGKGVKANPRWFNNLVLAPTTCLEGTGLPPPPQLPVTKDHNFSNTRPIFIRKISIGKKQREGEGTISPPFTHQFMVKRVRKAEKITSLYYKKTTWVRVVLPEAPPSLPPIPSPPS